MKPEACLAAAVARPRRGRAAPPAAPATVGQPAPAFSAIDASGKTVSLADFKGKTVVLEWVNPGCPYVRKHYDSANMQATQKDAAAKGVVWLAVNSTARQPRRLQDAGRDGGLDAEPERRRQRHADGRRRQDRPRLRRAHHAAHVRHRRQGTLVYAGAIDDKPSANPADIEDGDEPRQRGAGRRAGRQAGGAAGDAGLRLLGEVRGRLTDGARTPAASPVLAAP